MKLVSKTKGTKTVELNEYELRLLISALKDYVHRAFEITNDYDHYESIRSISSEMTEIYIGYTNYKSNRGA
jgi:hypothetical protein